MDAEYVQQHSLTEHWEPQPDRCFSHLSNVPVTSSTAPKNESTATVDSGWGMFVTNMESQLIFGNVRD
jgi:hypothetical protein